MTGDGWAGPRAARRPSPPRRPCVAGAQPLLGVFLLALAGVVFQLALTRLCSAAFNYHLAFLAAGAAMVGAGAGGVWVAVWLPAAPAGRERRRLGWCATGSAAAMAAVAAAFAWAPLGSAGPRGLLLGLLAGYPLVALPAFFAGAAITLALRRWPGAAGRTYAADLLGAGGGCVAALGVMQAAGPPWAVAGSCAAALAAARCFGPFGRRRLVVPAVLLLVAAAAALRMEAPNVLSIKPLAIYLDPVAYPDAVRELTRWDAFARVDVFDAPGAQLLWQTGAHRPQPLPDLRGITIDGDALSAVVRAEAGQPLALAPHLPTSLPYAVGPRARVLVIGPGGGVDVAAALHFGAQRVDAVEVNPGIVRVMLGPLAEFSGRLYRRPGVRLVVDEGRSYVRRSTDRYDAIVLTAVDSWAALAAGAYSLSENYLYTVEAVGDFYDHLTDGGVLAISRWYTRPPREMERLVIMAGHALAARTARVERALLVLRAGDFGTLLMRRGPFGEMEVARARAFAARNGFGLAYDPADGRGEFAGVVAGAADETAAGPPPPTDDRPFFFDFAPWSDVVRGRMGAPGLPRGHAVLLVALLQGGCLALGSTILFWRRLRAGLRPEERLVVAGYFGAIGGGFMLAETALLQRFTLFLGHPTLSLSATLAGLLAGAGAGSALWGHAGRPHRSGLGMLAAAGGLAVQALALPPVLGWGLGWPLPARIGGALAALLPVAALMGPALPAGMAALATGEAVPWAWGITGAASAIGAALAVMLAMEWGVTAALLAAAACYAAAGLLLALHGRGGTAETAAELGRMR